MEIRFHSTVIMTDDFDKMKNFYHNILKLEIEVDFGNCISFKNGLSIWKLNNDFTISQKLGRTYDKSGNKNIELCFETDAFDNVIEELNKLDLIYLHKVIEEPWGQRTIRFYDPENNLVEIGESVSCFVKRFYNQGLTFEEVAKRTSVPLNLVKKYVG